jgi:chloride channel 3/4/5
MGGTELVYELFAECRTGGNAHSGLCVLDPGDHSQVWPLIRAILVAMIVKGALTVVTFGIRVPAGIFIPTLGVGACAGRLLGISMQWLQWKYPNSRVFAACGGNMDCVVPGLYAMVGAAATLSGVTVSKVIQRSVPIDLFHFIFYFVGEAHNRVTGCHHV